MAISKTAAKKLRDLYLGEIVIIHLRDLNLIIMDEQHGEVKVAPMIEETIFDIDEAFVYTGNVEVGVTKTIPHESIGLIEISLGLVGDFTATANSDEDIH